MHITGAAGICIIAPCSANIVRLLQHYKIGVSPLFQADSHTQASEAGAQNSHPEMFDGWFVLCCCVRKGGWLEMLSG